MFNISKLQSAGGKLTELLEENYSIHCDQNNSKMILGHGKIFFSWRTLSNTIGHVLSTVKTQIEIFLAEYWCNSS